MLYELIDGVTDGLIAWNAKYWSLRTALRLLVVAVCVYGGWQALQPDLTVAQRAFRFGVPVLLVAVAFLMPMPRKRT
ncbi:MAG TPA: hypothetical protein VFY65_16210 [Longimicrobium sp.]|nr:hypothetical protein [Longimicrobium sp.]